VQVEMKKTRQMSCGACGGKEFHVRADNPHSATILVIECLKCKSTSIYTTEIPKMVQDWGENSDGVTCFMGKEE